jgi:hypothetical protein
VNEVPEMQTIKAAYEVFAVNPNAAFDDWEHAAWRATAESCR